MLPKLSLFCPHCHRHTALSAAPVEQDRGDSVDAVWRRQPYDFWWIGVCNFCNMPVLVHNDGVEAYPTPLPMPTDDRVPEAIRKDLDEAKACLQIKAHCAAAVMARRAIQQVAKDKGCERGDLVGQINELAARGVITSEVKDWATLVRWVGNDAAHPNGLSVEKDDAEDIIELAEQLLQVVYVAPAIAHHRRSVRGR